MSKKMNTKSKQASADIEDEDYIPESSFARIKAFWLFKRPGMRQIPYIQDLEYEAVTLYLMPGLLLVIGVLTGLIVNTQIDLFDLIIVLFRTITVELISILAFSIILFIFMKFSLPGFPKESHASPKMVLISFSYVYLTKIILIFGFDIWLFFANTSYVETALTLYILTFYVFSVYFVVVSAFSIRSLTGIGLINSLIGGFFLFFTVMIAFFLI